jgi:hypothetical protein
MRRRTLLLILFACAVPRFAAFAVWRADPATLYYDLSTALLREHRFALDGEPTTYIEPLYPAALAAGRLATGDHPIALLALQILLASWAGVLLFELTRHLTGRTRAAWIATLLYALSPYLVRQSVSFMEVTIATVLVIAAAWRMRRMATTRDAVGAGLLFGALVLTRFSFLPIAAGGVLVVAWQAGVRRALVTAVTLAASVLPWMIYCQATSGLAFPPRVGENLFVSTSAIAGPVVPRINVDVLVPLTDDLVRDEMQRRGVTSYDAAGRDRMLLRFAADYARANPLAVARLKLRNLAYIFQPRLLPFFDRVGRATIVDGRLEIPQQRRRPIAFEIVAAAFHARLLFAGAAGFVIRRKRIRDDAFLLLAAGSIVAVNTLFFPTSRLLAPMTPLLMFYAGVALDRLSRQWWVGSSNGEQMIGCGTSNSAIGQVN